MRPTRLPTLLALTTIALAGCSLILPLEECTRDGDCPSGQQCTNDHLCRAADVACDQIIGAGDAPDALWLGVILPLSGKYAGGGLDALKAITLATDQINANGGIGGQHAERPLAFRVCDARAVEDGGVKSAAWLASQAIPAVVGPSFSSTTLAVANEVAIPEGMLLISGSATASEIGKLADDDLVWRTAPPDRFQGETMAFFGYWRYLEAAAAGTTPVRVGLVHYDDAYGQGLASEFRSRFETRAEGQSDWVLEEHGYADDSPEEIQQAADWIADFAPHVVAIIGFEEVTDLFELAAPSLADATLFLTDGARTALLRTAAAALDERPQLFGVNAASRGSAVFERYATAFEDAYSVTPPVWSENFYDATYLVAYALAAVEAEAPTGPEMAAAFKRLSDPDGLAVATGPSDLLSAMRELGRGGALDVEGASGKMDFDPETGERQSVSILRWTYADADATDFHECGVVSRYSREGTDRDWCAAQCLAPDAAGCLPEVMAE